MATGVLAIQGDFERHLAALRSVGGEAIEVRTEADLAAVDRLILPGGESTTVGKHLQRFGLGAAIRQRAKDGMPAWGTCMGMILMAHDIEGSPSQYTLDLLDVTVRRNAFGAQVHSFEDDVEIFGLQGAATGVFIRAPVAVRMGPGVEVLGEYKGSVVAVRQGKRIGTAFHPELTDDTRLHSWFLGI